jgi:hypothetical protein
MELKNICTDINSTESFAAERTSHFLLASLVIYGGFLLVKRFNLRWYSIIILTPIILLLAWNMGWFAGIPIYYGCELFGLNK